MKNLTVWKFRDCSISQILREFNFGDSRTAKSAILTLLKALNFDFYDFFYKLLAEIKHMNKIQSPKMANFADLHLLNSSKIGFTQNLKTA